LTHKKAVKTSQHSVSNRIISIDWYRTDFEVLDDPIQHLLHFVLKIRLASRRINLSEKSSRNDKAATVRIACLGRGLTASIACCSRGYLCSKILFIGSSAA
jgi:hypothetical protein